MTILLYLINNVMSVIGGFLEMMWYAVAYKYRRTTLNVIMFIIVFLISRALT